LQTNKILQELDTYAPWLKLLQEEDWFDWVKLVDGPMQVKMQKEITKFINRLSPALGKTPSTITVGTR
jgi:hypothetical protein